VPHRFPANVGSSQPQRFGASGSQQPISESASDGKYVYVSIFPSRPWSHLGLAGFHEVDVSPKGYILNLGICRDKSVRPNHVSKGDQRSLLRTGYISEHGFSEPPGRDPFPVHTDVV
jgi:hypothetical protein